MITHVIGAKFFIIAFHRPRKPPPDLPFSRLHGPIVCTGMRKCFTCNGWIQSNQFIFISVQLEQLMMMGKLYAANFNLYAQWHSPMTNKGSFYNQLQKHCRVHVRMELEGFSDYDAMMQLKKKKRWSSVLTSTCMIGKTTPELFSL
ncbi:uncharacterized protein [Elaeis guineensis]|uniref:uncharacterized protein isoform X3 n=1 Tax=Elaeis guineensis var. tenera TaxID=51953 RepID=UPI003C6D6A14